jgi:cell division protein FtsW
MNRWQSFRDTLGRDLLFFAVATALPLFGLLILHPASSLVSIRTVGVSDYYVSRQLIWFALGFTGMVTVSYLPLQTLRSLSLPLLFVTMLSLVLVFIPGIGDSVSSSRESFNRWLVIGPFRFQPSEFAKFTIVLYFSGWLSKGDVLRHDFPLPKLIPPVILLAVILFLIVLQPQYGTTIAIIGSLLVILYLAGFPMLRLLAVIAAGSPFIAVLGFLRQYRLDRFKVWLNPYSYRHEGGYQLVTSFRAFLDGGLTGVDLSHGFAHRYLTFGHTDFIFALLAEDYGLIGIYILILLFTVYAGLAVYNIYKISSPFPFLLGASALTMLMIQMLMNTFVVTGFMPVTGVSLPFISYGGSSLITSMLFSGLILNVTRYARSSGDSEDEDYIIGNADYADDDKSQDV